MQEALKRLTDKQTFDRNFRLRRAIQLNAIHEVLPQDEWTRPQDDEKYLWPLIEDVCRERDERKRFDAFQPPFK